MSQTDAAVAAAQLEETKKAIRECYDRIDSENQEINRLMVLAEKLTAEKLGLESGKTIVVSANHGIRYVFLYVSNYEADPPFIKARPVKSDEDHRPIVHQVDELINWTIET